MGRASRRNAANRTQGVLNEARNIIERVGGQKEIIVRRDLPQEENISPAVCKLLESEVPINSSLEGCPAALQFIVIAWNVSLLEAGKRFQVQQELAARITAVDEVERGARPKLWVVAPQYRESRQNPAFSLRMVKLGGFPKRKSDRLLECHPAFLRDQEI